MIDKLNYWLECEVFYYFKIVFLLIFKKLDVNMLGEMISTKITYEDWTDKVAFKNAIKAHDWELAEKIANETKVNYEFDQKVYNKFLRKVLMYLIFTIIIIVILFIGLVLLFEGRL